MNTIKPSQAFAIFSASVAAGSFIALKATAQYSTVFSGILGIITCLAVIFTLANLAANDINPAKSLANLIFGICMGFVSSDEDQAAYCANEPLSVTIGWYIGRAFGWLLTVAIVVSIITWLASL